MIAGRVIGRSLDSKILESNVTTINIKRRIAAGHAIHNGLPLVLRFNSDRLTWCS